jgi:hypothetical protein
VSLGLGAAERVFPRLPLRVPFAEFGGAVTRVPQMVWPLHVTKGRKRLLLRASNDVGSSRMPPPIEVDPQSMTPVPEAPRVPTTDPGLAVTFVVNERPLRTDRSADRARRTIPYGGMGYRV